MRGGEGVVGDGEFLHEGRDAFGQSLADGGGEVLAGEAVGGIGGAVHFQLLDAIGGEEAAFGVVNLKGDVVAELGADLAVALEFIHPHEEDA